MTRFQRLSMILGVIVSFIGASVLMTYGLMTNNASMCVVSGPLLFTGGILWTGYTNTKALEVLERKIDKIQEQSTIHSLQLLHIEKHLCEDMREEASTSEEDPDPEPERSALQEVPASVPWSVTGKSQRDGRN